MTLRTLSILLLLLWPALAAAQSVFAAASLSSALSEIATHYEGMRLSVASSSTLAKQIAAGAPADIYFSANAEWMDYLQTRQHIEQDTRVDLLGNALVVIAPREEPFSVRWTRDFDFASAFAGRLALGNPDHVPAGQYARQALEALGWWPALKTRTAPAPDVRAALVYVERGECAVGLVYATDAAQSDRVITIATVPDSLHRPIVYPAAIVKGRASVQTRSLLAFFSSEPAADIFRKHGFTFLGDQRVQR
ncbi:MAG: molybdate ABC transporter substrate-binding protein [Gemmatimonadetes bacterium]|nr:molybdate ABC transporter substrate-binding protein [Gemmatimonadota bacterium]MYC73135.1 molybdate ABC transporter substrate-binding protein [Gemmatimonadota bacterium]MYI61875.1 molybdate ABC transporter substrate-binding protein [Gemmatimonadota bacterium]